MAEEFIGPEGDGDDELIIPGTLPLLPVRDIVIFPFMIVPLFVGRERSINAVDAALTKDRLILMATQKDISQDDPEPDDLHSVGTIGMIMRMLKLPDGRVKVLVQGLARAKVESFTQSQPSYAVNISQIKDGPTGEITLEQEALMRNVKEQLEKLASMGKAISPEIMMVLESIQEPGRLADLVASNLGLQVPEAQTILETLRPYKRLEHINEYLGKELEVSKMQVKIQSQARDEMDKTQREYFLREQMRAIKNELGDIEEVNEDVEEFREKIAAAKMPEGVEKEATKQCDRLEMMHPDAAEAGLIRTYLEWLVELPWAKSTKDRIDIKKAKKILDEDHYDLEKIKERILEFLAVRKLQDKSKGPILCFLGPPGVGKTSLGRSIAKAMGRKFMRISLGGIRDEAEIRGHRRTYVGSLPGRIIQGIKQVESNNPVFMLDEIDKLGMDFHGDPSSALLEVLDPEQNNTFSDHYLNVPFDLSNVMFIATANQGDPIPGPLMDRMELITLSGYTEEDKLAITKKYIIPRQVTNHGLTGKNIDIKDTAVKRAISEYTREAGLRNLEREIGSICRKVAKGVASGNKKRTVVTAKSVPEYLGPPKFTAETERELSSIGLATGLAWTPVGGEILHIETTVMKGKGSLTLTGQLGDVMKESAQAAMSYARTNAERLGIDPDFAKGLDIHIHVPAGAIPKDGPSAGVTMATSLVSALTKTPINRDVAMTGEITLRGRVLPVGGIKDKCLAAIRLKVKTIIIPERNKNDIAEIPEEIRSKVDFVLARHIDDALEVALKKKGRRKKISGKMSRGVKTRGTKTKGTAAAGRGRKKEGAKKPKKPAVRP